MSISFRPLRLSTVLVTAVAVVCWAFLLVLPGVCRAAPRSCSAILYNLSTGRILWQKNAGTSIPPASLTKVMTMYLALDRVRAGKLSLKRQIRIPAQAVAVGGSTMHLRSGEKVPLDQLLTGMAVASGNDAAMTVAMAVGPNLRSFVRQMNARARALGMRQTSFKNPTGLPAAGQKTSARDMLTLCRAYLSAHPSALRYHSTRYFRHGRRGMGNTNPLLGSIKGVDGLKTGWTQASGYNIIVTAQRGKTRLMAIVLGCKTRPVRDALAHDMIETGFRWPSSSQKVREQLGR